MKRRRYQAHPAHFGGFTRREYARGLIAALVGAPLTWLLLVVFWSSQGLPR